MGPILRLQPKLNIEQLYEQLDYSQGVLGKGREFVTQYLLDDGVDNLEDITVDDLKVYRKYVKSLLMINKNQKKYFMNLLEQVTFQEGKSFVAPQKIVISKAMDREIELLRRRLKEKDREIVQLKSENVRLQKALNAKTLDEINNL